MDNFAEKKTVLEIFKSFKELEIADGDGSKTVGDFLPEFCKKIEEALQRLEAIDNANPSEALEKVLDKAFDYGVQSTLDNLMLRGYNTKNMLEQELLGNTLEKDLYEAKRNIGDMEIVKKTLIKSQEQEKENAKLKGQVNYLTEVVNEFQKKLSIIKEKGVDVGYLKTCKTLEEYNSNCWDDEEDFNKKLTQEEFDLLKEYFKNEN